MPLITAFSEVRLCGGEERSTVCTAGFSVCEGVRGAVTQLPIAYGSFGYIDKKSNTGCNDANQSSSNPSRAGIEGGEQTISKAWPGVDRTKAVGVFDLAAVNTFLLLFRRQDSARGRAANL